MVDLCDKRSESEEMNSQQSQTTTLEKGSLLAPQVKTCFDCGTTKTPLWRGGPAGPKSLCNACGIRSRKRRRALLGLNKEEKKTKKTASNNKCASHHQNNNNNYNSNSTSNNNNNNNNNNKGYESTSSTADSTSKYADTLKRKIFTFGRDHHVALQRPRSSTTQRRKLGEEEQAAFLLMALSCGSVYA